jgi:hypothetical protein
MEVPFVSDTRNAVGDGFGPVNGYHEMLLTWRQAVEGVLSWEWRAMLKAPGSARLIGVIVGYVA